MEAMISSRLGSHVVYVPETVRVVKRNLNDLKHEKSKNVSVLGDTLVLMQTAPIATTTPTMQLKTSIASRHGNFSKSGLRAMLKKMPPMPEPMVVMPMARPFRMRNQWFTTAVDMVVMKAEHREGVSETIFQWRLTPKSQHRNTGRYITYQC